MSDDTRLPLYCVMRLHNKICGIIMKETLLVSLINVDVLFGLPSLVNHHCTVDFNLPIEQLVKRSLTCTDRHEQTLNCIVQIQQMWRWFIT